MNYYSELIQTCLKATESSMRTITQEEFNELVEKHKLWLEEEDEDEEKRLILHNVKLSHLYLSNMNLQKSLFYNCIFDHVIMENTDFRESIIGNSYVSCCGFDRIRVSNIKWQGVSFYNSELKNISQTKYSVIRDCNFDKTMMANLNFYRASLTKTIMDRCQILDSEFTHCSLILPEIKFSKLDNVIFNDDSIKHAEFNNVDLFKTDFRSTYLCNSKFINCRLDKTSLFKSIIDNIQLTHNNMLEDKIIQMGPIGSRDAYTLYFIDKDNVRCGCWKDYKGGTLEEFKQEVEKVYPNGEYHDEYMIAIETFKKQRELYLKSRRSR